MTMSTMVDPLNIESIEGEASRLFSVSGGVRLVCGDRNIIQVRNCVSGKRWRFK